MALLFKTFSKLSHSSRLFEKVLSCRPNSYVQLCKLQLEQRVTCFIYEKNCSLLSVYVPFQISHHYCHTSTQEPPTVKHSLAERKQIAKERVKVLLQQKKYSLQQNQSKPSVNNHVLPREKMSAPYVNEHFVSKNNHVLGRKVYMDVFGCEMNVSDADIVKTILTTYGYTMTSEKYEADVFLVMTCAIRDSAERKIWLRLKHFEDLKKKKEKNKYMRSLLGPIKIGVLGCMASRLKNKIWDELKSVDVICGPDSYKDLPLMLMAEQSGQAAVNAALSLDETYADIRPVQKNNSTAFVSIMRGCDNMCTYCIVPFTRGKERSRPIDSIIDEVKMLSEQGVKCITLLGQNVNSYRDLSESIHYGYCDPTVPTKMSSGFKTVYKPKMGGRRFSDLLEAVSSVDPEMRIKFNSPHPKDFPDEVLQLIKERPNIMNKIHLPAQSGSNKILEAMRRGYTRESYLELADKIKTILPEATISSDFISGFCGETEEDHEQTLSLMRLVKYNFAFCFAYSMREKTKAFHKLVDDVPREVKVRRLQELVELFREIETQRKLDQIGQIHCVMIEKNTFKFKVDGFSGKNCNDITVACKNTVVFEDETCQSQSKISIGDYVAVKITAATSQTFYGEPLYITSLKNFTSLQNKA